MHAGGSLRPAQRKKGASEEYYHYHDVDASHGTASPFTWEYQC